MGTCSIQINNMSLQLTKGVIRGAQKGLMYGVSGVGKTFLAAQIAKLAGPVVFIDSEDGTKELDVARYSVSTWQELEEAVKLVENSDAKVAVLDSIDWIEKLLTRKVCEKGDEKGVKRERIEDFGYGRGWKYLREELEKFLFRLDSLLRKGIHVLLIGHSEVVKFQEPERTEAYDRYELKLDKENSANVREWCGFVLFLNWKVSVIETENKKLIGTGGKERVLYTQHSAGWDAKNRHGLADKLKGEIKSLEPIFGLPVLTIQESPPVAKPGLLKAAFEDYKQLAAADLTAQSTPDCSEILGKFIELTGELDVDLLKNFLISRNVITTSLMEVPEDYAKEAVSRIAAFKEAVLKFGKQNAKINVS